MPLARGVSPDDQRPTLADVPGLLAQLDVYLDELGNTLDEVGISPRDVNTVLRALGASRVDHGVIGVAVPVLLAQLGVYLDEVGNTLDEGGISPRAGNAILRALGASRGDHGVIEADIRANRADIRALVSGVYANRA